MNIYYNNILLYYNGKNPQITLHKLSFNTLKLDSAINVL